MATGRCFARPGKLVSKDTERPSAEGRANNSQLFTRLTFVWHDSVGLEGRENFVEDASVTQVIERRCVFIDLSCCANQAQKHRTNVPGSCNSLSSMLLAFVLAEIALYFCRSTGKVQYSTPIMTAIQITQLLGRNYCPNHTTA